MEIGPRKSDKHKELGEKLQHLMRKTKKAVVAIKMYRNLEKMARRLKGELGMTKSSTECQTKGEMKARALYEQD